MPINKIQSILAAHGIPCRIIDGRIWADPLEAHREDPEWEDLTGFTRAELYEWLGY